MCSFWSEMTDERLQSKLDGLVARSPAGAVQPHPFGRSRGAGRHRFPRFRIGQPQRLLITVEIWLEDVSPPAEDDPSQAWDYDYLRTEVEALAGAQRYNLQETLAHAIYQRFAAMRGVKALRVATAKPDIYDEARGVGVEITSFN